MPELNKRFLDAVQARAARIAVSASATRSQGGGVVLAARFFLEAIPLAQFSCARPRTFSRHLDDATLALRRSLPPNCRSWGLARKLLNIFLRDALYTCYLRDKYELGRSEAFMEIPLDSITTKKLRESAGRRVLPRWRGVKYLRPAESQLYQEHARVVAAREDMARIHLDTFWWGRRQP
jgi:hypothetical protein